MAPEEDPKHIKFSKMRRNHHCPGEFGTVDGHPGNCRRTRTHCSRHQWYCSAHDNAYMKGRARCKACELQAKAMEEKIQKKDDGDSNSKEVKGKKKRAITSNKAGNKEFGAAIKVPPTQTERKHMKGKVTKEKR